MMLRGKLQDFIKGLGTKAVETPTVGKYDEPTQTTEEIASAAAATAETKSGEGKYRSTLPSYPD